MEATVAAPREIAVPVSIFGALRSELSKEAGELPTIHALHRAGFTAGSAAAPALTSGGRNGISGMGQAAFWARLCDFFVRRGWGSLKRTVSHPGIAVLSSPDWAEANPGVIDSDASCCFSTGFLSGLLSEVAGGPVAVLEVECRTRGDARCGFAFGSEAAIHDLYGRLLDGDDLEAALAAL